MKFELSEYITALNEHNSWCLLAFSVVNTKLALKRHRLQACQLSNENPLFHISNNSPHPYPLKKKKTNFCSWNYQAKIKKGIHIPRCKFSHARVGKLGSTIWNNLKTQARSHLSTSVFFSVQGHSRLCDLAIFYLFCTCT